MRTLLSRHCLITVQLAIVGLLLVGLVERTGVRFLPHIAIYGAALVVAYSLVQRFIGGRSIPWEFQAFPTALFIKAVLIAQVLIMILHWSQLGEIPLWTALHEQDDLLILSLRRSAGEGLPLLLNYGSHLMIKALVPIALVLAWSTDRRLFWLLACSASLYALSLLAKSFVITLFIPLWVAFIVHGKWKQFIALSLFFFLSTFALSTAANPQKLRSTTAVVGVAEALPEDQGVREHGLVGDALLGIGKRIILMPGWTVAVWFEHIPSDQPFVHGGAIRPLAALLNIPFEDLTERMYALEYPEMAAQNVPGTLGTASFMYGYANFGTWGLAASGLITALMIAFAQACFGGVWRWALALNMFPLLALCGSALPTVLITHGWALTLLLFLVLRPKHEPAV